MILNRPPFNRCPITTCVLMVSTFLPPSSSSSLTTSSSDDGAKGGMKRYRCYIIRYNFCWKFTEDQDIDFGDSKLLILLPVTVKILKCVLCRL